MQRDRGSKEELVGGIKEEEGGKGRERSRKGSLLERVDKEGGDTLHVPNVNLEAHLYLQNLVWSLLLLWSVTLLKLSLHACVSIADWLIRYKT